MKRELIQNKNVFDKNPLIIPKPQVGCREKGVTGIHILTIIPPPPHRPFSYLYMYYIILGVGGRLYSDLLLFGRNLGRDGHPRVLQQVQKQRLQVQYSTVQYSTVQYSTVHYSTVQYSSVQDRTGQDRTGQDRTGQYSTV